VAIISISLANGTCSSTCPSLRLTRDPEGTDTASGRWVTAPVLTGANGRTACMAPLLRVRTACMRCTESRIWPSMRLASSLESLAQRTHSARVFLSSAGDGCSKLESARDSWLASA